MKNLQLALRALARAPGFCLTAVLLVAIGIAASTTAFTLVDALFFRARQGVADARTLYNVHPISTRDASFGGWSHPDFRTLRGQLQPFGDTAAFTGIEAGLKHGGRSETLLLQLVSANFFELLGTRPALGRFFLAEEDDVPGRDAVAVISHRLWRNRFGGAPDVIGERVQLNGADYTVIGVAEPGFHGTFIGFDFDAFVPLAMARLARQEASLSRPDAAWLELLMRTDRPVPAQAEFHRLALALAAGRPAEQREFITQLHPNRPIDDSLRGAALGLAGVLSALAVLVLLVACLNLGSLLLTRTEERRRESAVRLALGAAPKRLVLDWMAECAVIFLIGGALGLLLAHVCAGADLFRQPSAALGLTFDFSPDSRAFAFSLAVTIITGALTGLVPALRAAKTNLVNDLKSGGASFGGPARLRHFFVGAQIACSIVPLVVAGLFARTIARNAEAHPGFAADGLLAIELNLSLLGDDTGRRGREAATRLLEAARQVPGVAGASFASRMPLSLRKQRRTYEVAPPAGGADLKSTAWVTAIEGDYFTTLGARLLAGRALTMEDSFAGAAPVMVIGETAARAWFGAADPLQREVRGGETTYRVVGVVADVKYGALWEQPVIQTYVPVGSAPRTRFHLIARAAAAPGLVGPALSRALQGVAPDLPLGPPLSAADHIDFSLIQQRLGARVAASLGAVCLLLAGIGLYSTLALGAARQTREYGLRLALGSTPAGLAALVARRAGRLVAVGAAGGVAAAWAAATLLRGLLHGVSATDPLVYAATAVVLLLITVLACWLPARRAARVNPLTALRAE